MATAPEVPDFGGPLRLGQPVSLCLIIATVLVVACAPSQVELDVTRSPTPTYPPPMPVDELLPLFDYDSEAPLDVEEVSTENWDGVAVHDISYASPMGGRVTAYLVIPPGEGRFAGLVYAHPGDGDRTFFLEEAVTVARGGGVSILVDSPWARPHPWRRELNYTPKNDRAAYVQEIIDLRRAVDLLASRDDVDPNRLAFVGYSYGAHVGGVLSGVEKRIKAYVLMAGVPASSERIPRRISSTLSGDDLNAYLEAIRPLDAVQHVAHAAPAALFFQCAREDEIIPSAISQRYYDVASPPKHITWYDTGHRLNEQARRDRFRWLVEQIGLNMSAVE